MSDDELSSRRRKKRELENEIDHTDDRLLSLKNMILRRMSVSEDEGEKTAFSAVILFMSHLGLWNKDDDD